MHNYEYARVREPPADTVQAHKHRSRKREDDLGNGRRELPGRSCCRINES